jgi:Dyp-type peroxidase family
MIAQRPAREAPYPSIFPKSGPCRPDVPDEPVLDVRNIQGNILGGFNKDFQILLFLEITQVDQFRRWLKELTPFVATTAEVLAFNRLFKEIRSRRGDSLTVQSTWMNLAISSTGLRKLAPGEADKFKDQAFQEGLARRSEALGDPTEGEGSPGTWVVGSGDNEADVVLVFAADDRDDLLAEVARIEDSIYSARTPDGQPLRCGVRIIHKQHGAVLPPPLTGHEHFGFLDGVSQPGLRGRISQEPWDVLTPRQNPDDIDQGKPGQDLLWPGEFVFGYPGQDPAATQAEGGITKKGPDSLQPNGPEDAVAPDWAKDGAYLVFRRLRQDVPGFHRFIAEQAEQLGMADPGLLGAKLVGRWKSGAPIMRAPLQDDRDLAGNDCANNDFEFASESETETDTKKLGMADPGLLGAKLVGRWKSGAPIMRAPLQDDRDLVGNDYANNDFEFASESETETDTREASPSRGPASCLCERLPEPEPDDEGLTCPFAAHIRKTYPRNDTGTLDPSIGEVTTQTHRLLRRGIPFGPPYPIDPPPNQEDSGDRGLLFLAYQTSIEEQFEFVQKSWCNNPDFKDVPDGAGPRSGHDLIIGQSGGANRERFFVLPGQNGRHVLTTEKDWVIPTGGGYFFAPSIRALEQLANGDLQ